MWYTSIGTEKPHDKLQGFVVGLDKAPLGAVAVSWMITDVVVRAPAILCLACLTCIVLLVFLKRRIDCLRW